jgi:hypothetical protein
MNSRTSLPLNSGERALAAASASRRREASSPALTMRVRESGLRNAHYNASTARLRLLPALPRSDHDTHPRIEGERRGLPRGQRLLDGEAERP